MIKMIITVLTNEEAEKILDVLREAEEEAEIDFPFNVQINEDGIKRL